MGKWWFSWILFVRRQTENRKTVIFLFPISMG